MKLPLLWARCVSDNAACDMIPFPMKETRAVPWLELNEQRTYNCKQVATKGERNNGRDRLGEYLCTCTWWSDMMSFRSKVALWPVNAGRWELHNNVFILAYIILYIHVLLWHISYTWAQKCTRSSYGAYTWDVNYIYFYLVLGLLHWLLEMWVLTRQWGLEWYMTTPYTLVNKRMRL